MPLPEVHVPLEETDPEARHHIAKVKAEHDEQYLALRRRAQGLFAALKGRTGVHTPEGMEQLFQKARQDHESGAFLLERLGTSRYTDPELVAVLIQLRTDLLADRGSPTAADKMQADMAVLAYRNALRIQILISSALMETERHLFGQLSLDEVLGQSEAEAVIQLLERVEQILMPLLERCQRMMLRSLNGLQVAPVTTGNARVSIGVAGQVNVDAREIESDRRTSGS